MITYLDKFKWPRDDALTSILERVSNSRFCPSAFFYCHSIIGLKYKASKCSYPFRTLNDLQIFVIDNDHDDSIDVLKKLNEMVSIMGDDAVTDQVNIFRALLESGAKCIIVKIKNLIVGFNWAFKTNYLVTFDDYESKNMNLILAKDCIFFGNGYIQKDYRLRGIFPVLLQESMKLFPEHFRFFTTVDNGNNISLSSHRHFGYEPVFLITCFAIGKFHFFILKTIKSGKKKSTFLLFNKKKQ